MNELNLILGAKKILSVNALYSAMMVSKGGRQYATIYKSRDAKNVEAYIGEQIKALNIPTNYPWITKDTLFSYSINVIFKSGYLSRDLDNTIKLIQDGIFRALDINDSHVVQIFAKKSYMPDISEEKICISLKEFKNEKELRIDYVPVPDMIWTDWEDKNLLGLKEFGKKKMKGVQYLVSSKEDANTKLLVIDPSKLTYNTFGDIYLEITENLISSSGLVYIAILNKPIDKNIADSLSKFEDKIKEMSKQYSGIRLKTVSTPEEIKSWVNYSRTKDS